MTWLATLALLAWFGIGSVRAQAMYADQGAAYAGCQAGGTANMALASFLTQKRCTYSPNISSLPGYICEVFNNVQKTWGACALVGSLGGRDHRYPAAKTCSAKGSQVTQFLPLSGSTQCWGNCVYSYAQNGDDETSTRSPTGGVCTDEDFKKNCPAGWFWNGHMGVCQPVEPNCPEGQERVDGVCKPSNQCPEGMVAVQGSTAGAIQQGALYCKKAENECPAGNVKSPEGKCLPGEGQCAAGEARRPNGTCGKDANNDGVADDDDNDPNNDTEKGTFSGGDSCDLPPSCSGDAIMCGQARIQWRIDCNTRKNRNVSGGTCNAPPICTGKNCDAVEYSQMMFQWRTACALEKGIKVTGNEGGGDDEKIKPDFEALNAGGDGDDGQGSILLPADGTPSLNESKIAYGAGLSPILAEVEGVQFRIPQAVLDWLGILRWLIIALATLSAIAIIRGS